MDEEPSSSSENPNSSGTICSEEIAPAILSTSGTWLRLSMPYFPKKSVVWRYFDLYESDGYSRADTERIVKCRLITCMRKELRLDAQSSTKGMWEHLRNKHPDEALKCENGSIAPQEEPSNTGAMESAAATNQQIFVAPNPPVSDVYAPYSSLADEKKYETIHRLIGKLLASMQKCQDRVHISEQYTLLSFADYARLLTKAKTTTQFVCRDAPMILPEPGTIVIYDSKDNSDLDIDMLQMREHLRQDGYSFDNNDSGLLPDNLYITRYFNGNGDDFEDGRIMRYEVTTTFEDAGYVLFHYVKGTKYEVESTGSTDEIPVHCYKPKAGRLRRVGFQLVAIDENRRKTDISLNRGSPISQLPVKIKRNELDGLQAIAGCLPPGFQTFLDKIRMETDRDENLNGMDLSFEENVEAIGSGLDDSQIEDNCVDIAGLLTSSYPNRDLKQTLSVHDVKTDTKVEKRVMNILKKAVRDQRRSKVHYLARRTKNVNWVKVADQLQKKAVMIAAATSNGDAIATGNVITHEFEEEEEEGPDCNNDINDDGDDDDNNNGDNNNNGNDEHVNNISPNYDDSPNCNAHLSNTLDNSEI